MKYFFSLALVCTVAACGATPSLAPQQSVQPLTNQQIQTAAAIVYVGNACAKKGWLANPAGLALSMNMAKAGLAQNPQRAEAALKSYSGISVQPAHCQYLEFQVAQANAAHASRVQAQAQAQQSAQIQDIVDAQARANTRALERQNLQNAQNIMRQYVGY